MQNVAIHSVVDALCGEDAFWNALHQDRTVASRAWAHDVIELVANSQYSNLKSAARSLEKSSRKVEVAWASK